MSDEKAMFVVGETFTSYAEFQEKLDYFQDLNHFKLYKKDCRTIDAAKKRAPRKNFKPELVYAALHFCCVHGGKYRSKSNGIRPPQRSIKLGCPMELKLATSPDGQALVITGFNSNHMHWDGLDNSFALDDDIDKKPQIIEDNLVTTSDTRYEVDTTEVKPMEAIVNPEVAEGLDDLESWQETPSFAVKTKAARKAIPRKALLRGNIKRLVRTSPVDLRDRRDFTSDEDEETLFGKLVAGRLRKLPNEMVRQSLKLKILGMIFQAEFGLTPDFLPKEQEEIGLPSTVVVCNEER